MNPQGVLDEQMMVSIWVKRRWASKHSTGEEGKHSPQSAGRGWFLSGDWEVILKRKSSMPDTRARASF